MARSFVNGTDAYIGTSVVNPQPFSIANWVYPTSPTTAGLSFGIGTLTGSHGSAIVGPANPSTANHWTVYLAGSIAADAGVALTLNVWSHCGFTAGTAVGWVAYTNGSQTDRKSV